MTTFVNTIHLERKDSDKSLSNKTNETILIVIVIYITEKSRKYKVCVQLS